MFFLEFHISASCVPCRHHSGPELAESIREPAAPVHFVHTGPRSGQGYENMTPYYETDIRPGQSVVMPGFTISIEAARGPQQMGADGLSSSQPVVTVTPAEGDGHLMTIGDQDFFPRQRQDQRQYYQQQQQQQQQQPPPPTLEHHPLAGIMRGQVTRQQVVADRSLYRETDRPAGRSLEQDMAANMSQQQQQQPVSPHHYADGVGYSSQQVAASRSQPGELMEQQRSRVESRGWTAQSEVETGHATYTETRPELDNVQVTEHIFPSTRLSILTPG